MKLAVDAVKFMDAHRIGLNHNIDYGVLADRQVCRNDERRPFRGERYGDCRNRQHPTKFQLHEIRPDAPPAFEMNRRSGWTQLALSVLLCLARNGQIYDS
jgi:hypothetical protein